MGPAMSPADKAVLRLAFGLALATLVSYGRGWPVPFVPCVMAILVLARPGPPLPLAKGVVGALLFAGLVAAGVLMVPLLEHYAATGVLLTAVLLFGVFFFGLRSASPLSTILAIAAALIPVAGVAEQGLVTVLGVMLAAGVALGTLVATLAHAFFPDPPAATAATAQARGGLAREAAAWIAARAVLIVMPVFVLALTDPSFYLAAILKTVALGQQAGENDARSAGRELVGSTLAGALLAAVVWTGLSLRPNLWMLSLWLSAAALWTGRRLFGLRPSRYRPSFWSNALVTALILLGPAIEDSASGKSVLEGALMRTLLFVAIALYATAMVWGLERWRRRRQAVLSAGEVSLEELGPGEIRSE